MHQSLSHFDIHAQCDQTDQTFTVSFSKCELFHNNSDLCKISKLTPPVHEWAWQLKSLSRYSDVKRLLICATPNEVEHAWRQRGAERCVATMETHLRSIDDPRKCHYTGTMLHLNTHLLICDATCSSIRVWLWALVLKSCHVMQDWFFRSLPVCTVKAEPEGLSLRTCAAPPETRERTRVRTPESARGVCVDVDFGFILIKTPTGTKHLTVFCFPPAVSSASCRVSLHRLRSQLAQDCSAPRSVNGKHLHNTSVFGAVSSASLWSIGWTPGRQILGKMETFFAEVGFISNNGASAMR